MKFTIAQKALLEGLQKVGGVIPPKSPTPILENVLLDLSEGILQITGTDLEVSVTTQVIPQSVEKEGAAAVPARVLTEMIRSLPDIPIQIEQNQAGRIDITTDRGFYRIAAIAKENFPEIGSVLGTEGGYTLRIPSEKLARMFGKTLFAVSSDELRPALMGVYVQIAGGELRMVATDGHRLSKIVDKEFMEAPKPLKMIVPPKAIQIALKHLSEEGTAELKTDERGLGFSFGVTRLYTRLVEGQYPDYERVIPRDNDKRLVVDRDMLLSTLKRVSLFSSALTHQVRFSLSPGTLTVQSEDPDIGGEAKETLSVTYTDESMEIGYNAQYLMEILREIDTDQAVFFLKSPINAALITPVQQVENEDFLMIVMPIRLSS